MSHLHITHTALQNYIHKPSSVARLKNTEHMLLTYEVVDIAVDSGLSILSLAIFLSKLWQLLFQMWHEYHSCE